MLVATRSLQLVDLNCLSREQMSQPQDLCLVSILLSIRLSSTELDENDARGKHRRCTRRQAIVSSCAPSNRIVLRTA